MRKAALSWDSRWSSSASAAVIVRLQEDLLARRTEAERRGWLGEADGIDQTLEQLQHRGIG